jgi:hypothetical protein
VHPCKFTTAAGSGECAIRDGELFGLARIFEGLNFLDLPGNNYLDIHSPDLDLPPPQPFRVPIVVSTTTNMSADEEKAKKQREAGEREAARLWRAWRTVHEMVQDRGYELTDEEVKISFDNFKYNYASDGEEDIIE